MSSPHLTNMSISQAHSSVQLLDEEEDDLKCPFCEVYFEKWSLLKQHLVRHVFEARAEKDFIAVSCLSASKPCVSAVAKDSALLTSTASRTNNGSSFHQLSHPGQGLTNDQTYIVTEACEKLNEHPYSVPPHVVRTGHGHSSCGKSSSEKETNAKETRLRNSTVACAAYTNSVNVPVINLIGTNSGLIVPETASSLLCPTTQESFVVAGSINIDNGQTPRQAMACNTIKQNQRPCIDAIITSVSIPDSSTIMRTAPVILSPVTRTSLSTFQTSVGLSSGIITPNIKLSDSFSSINLIPSTSLSQVHTIRVVPSLLSQVGNNSVATCDEVSTDRAKEESIDDPGFALQSRSAQLLPACGGKRLLQCVVRPFTTGPQVHQPQTSFIGSNTQCGHVALQPSLSQCPGQPAHDAPPLTAATACPGTAPAALSADQALLLGTSTGSEPSISTELASDVTATASQLPGAAATGDGAVDATAAEDGAADTGGGAKGKKTRRAQHCRTCRQFFPSREALQQHQAEAHNKGRPYECPECGRYFLSSHNLSTHRRHRHPTTAPAGSSPRRCGDCGKCFSSKANLALHAKLHSGERPFLCSVCGARFSRKCTLVSHLAYHSGDRRFTCERCGARFYTSHSLARHAKLHTGERSFVCELCGASYVTSSDLKRHQLSHGAVKPFLCTTCNKTFARKHDLKVHERYHSGEFGHECPHCGKRFVEQSNYRRHLRQHTGEKPYHCQACPLHFSQLHHLKKHLLSCSGPTEGVSTAAAAPLTAGPRTTRVGHLEKMSGS